MTFDLEDFNYVEEINVQLPWKVQWPLSLKKSVTFSTPTPPPLKELMCDKTFSRKETLKSHLWDVSGENSVKRKQAVDVNNPIPKEIRHHHPPLDLEVFNDPWPWRV